MKSSETYIVTAKTVDEAMAIAQREYGGSGKDISFDILEMPKKGFLGIGAKDAKIKVTVTEEEEINLGSIVAEMKSYRMHTDRDGGAARDGESGSRNGESGSRNGESGSRNGDSGRKTEKKPENRQDRPEKKQGENRQNGEKPAQPGSDKPRADRPVQKPARNGEKPAPKQEGVRQDRKPEGKQDRPAQKSGEARPKPEGQQKPAQPKQDKPAARQDKPAQPVKNADRPAPEKKPEQKPVTESPAGMPAKAPEKKAEAPRQEKKSEAPAAQTRPAFDTSRAGEAPVKKEAQASGILDNMPEYRITDSGSKTPVYRETGANVKTYTRNPMHTAAVADGSIGTESAPVVDVRWDSARDLKKAEEAAAAAMAAASRAAAPVAPAKAEETARQIEEAIEESYDNTESRFDVYREQAKQAGQIDVAALDAAIEAMVEELPAPESRKKTGITAAEMEYALAFVTTLLANMQIDAKAVALPCPEGEEYEIEGDANVYPAMEIVGEGTGILIGHHGETLDAIQYLLNLTAIRHSDNPNGDYVKISLDIENYRAKREETLRSLARRMAARALKYKRNVFLEPMNAYERRIIHSELQSVENVSTHSVGTDKNRKIIITYEGPDKVFDDRRRSDKPEGSGRGRDHGRNRKKTGDAQPAPAENTEAAEGEENAPAAQPAGEGKSRSRNRNRNRNRRRHSDGESAAASAAEEPTGGASAIISGEEREELDRQLTDPTTGADKAKKPQPVPVEDIPAFLQQPAGEPAEHLREN